MTNPNFEPRLTQAEQSIEGLQAAVSELRSTVSTLADIVGTHEQLHEQSRQRFDRFVEQAEQDRALMLRLIQTIAQGGNGGDRTEG
jgi:ABC-type transporter Mla subunit MlaD